MLFRKSFAFGLLTLSLVAPVACEKDDDGPSGGGSRGPFLRADDLPAGPKLKALSDAEVRAKLKGQPFLYDNEPKETQLAGDDDCVRQLFDGLIAEGDQHTLRFSGNLDATKCFQDDTKGLNISITFGGYFQYTCDSTDLGPYLGKSFGELSNVDGRVLNDVECATSTLFLNSQTDVFVSGEAKDEESGKSQSIRFQSVTYGYTGDANGNPCVATSSGGEKSFADGCLSIDKAVDVIDQTDGKAADDEGAEDYERYEMIGIKGEAKGTAAFYSVGKMSAQINGWKGEVTYSDLDTPPFFVLNDGKTQVEGALGVTGTGSLRFGDVQTMAYGTCGTFTLEVRSGAQKIPVSSDVAVTLASTDAKTFLDSSCTVEATDFAIPRGKAELTFYAKPKAASDLSFSISAQANSNTYGSPATLYVKVEGIDDGYLSFAETSAVKAGECKAIQIHHADGTPAASDVVIALASTDADLYADSSCATATTEVTLKKAATAATFYLKIHAGESSVTVTASPASPSPSMGSLYLELDQEKVTFSGASTIAINTCTVFALKHGYTSGDAAAPAAVAVALASVVVHYYADAGCAAEITSITIPAGETEVEFYVKAGSAGSALLTANPTDDSITFAQTSVTVSP